MDVTSLDLHVSVVSGINSLISKTDRTMQTMNRYIRLITLCGNLNDVAWLVTFALLSTLQCAQKTTHIQHVIKRNER